jgi:hypothetical protein
VDGLVAAADAARVAVLVSGVNRAGSFQHPMR